MKPVPVFLLLSCVLFASPAWADETFPDVEYISGKAGFAKKIKGTLTLGATDLRFTGKDATSVFTIPLAEITEASNSVEQNPGSTGAKIMLGIFASKKEEFVYITTETSAAAEALVFKVKNKTSPAIVAKLKFQLKQAKAQDTAPPPEAKKATPTGIAQVAPPDTSNVPDSLITK
jgi:hypothetical protein